MKYCEFAYQYNVIHMEYTIVKKKRYRFNSVLLKMILVFFSHCRMIMNTSDRSIRKLPNPNSLQNMKKKIYQKPITAKQKCVPYLEAKLGFKTDRKILM